MKPVRLTAFLLLFCSIMYCVMLAGAPAVAADAIKASAALPETSPWDLDRLSQAPKFQWVDESSPVRSMFYTGLPYQGHDTQVFAYYASPSTLAGKAPSADKFPAMVLIHGGGGTAFQEWAELWAKRGYAAIAMDLAGHRPLEGVNQHKKENRTRLENGGPNQGDNEKFGSVDLPPQEQWPYHAVADAILAHSLIRTFPEVDADRTAVTGISWGGYLTCIVSGVDSRFKASVPVYGCGFLHENSVWLPRFASMTPTQRDRWVTLWDPSRYLPAVTMPILFIDGTNDFAYPLDSSMKSYDAVPGQKQLRITVKMSHSHPSGWAPQEIGLFIDQYLTGGRPLPKLTDIETKNGQATIGWDSAANVKTVSLHFAIGDGPINKHDWTTQTAAISGHSATIALPAEKLTAWFFTVEDDRGAIVSSRVVLPAGK